MKDTEKQILLAKLAGKILGDRQLLETLGDRIYELMLEELRLKKERNRN
ncbi:hypothetical protein [Nostoc sp. CMAA1605]|nr:hypothetical protein [Nostoc sp. CMAA1605]